MVEVGIDPLSYFISGSLIVKIVSPNDDGGQFIRGQTGERSAIAGVKRQGLWLGSNTCRLSLILKL